MENPPGARATLLQPTMGEQSKITISSHNVNGFNRSKGFLRAQCSDAPDSIRAIQEHWLRPSFKKQAGVNQLRCLHPDFDGYGSSAMSDSKISIGRPYGGTGFLFNKKYSRSLKPVLNYSHERVTVMSLETDTFKILLINAYMPYYNSRDMDHYLSLYRETIGHIDSIMQQNQHCKFVILADLNCDIYKDNNCYTRLVKNLMKSHNLVSAFEKLPNFDFATEYTRCDMKTNSFTLIDGIIFSKDLMSIIDNVRIAHNGDNLSDHSPVEIDLCVRITLANSNPNSRQPFINWKKMRPDSLELFRTKMSTALSMIQIPEFTLHGSHLCSNDCHKLDIENYYDRIVEAVSVAESVLPLSNPSFQRPFWSDELSVLKESSIDCNNYWKSMGCPRSGPIYECRKNCHYQYKIAIRRYKKEANKRDNDDLFSDLADHDGNSFWSKWNSINRNGNVIASRIDGETDPQSIANVFADYFQSVYGNNDTPQHNFLNDAFKTSFADYYSEHCNDDLTCYFLNWSEMLNIASKIKLGKAASGAIRPEHFIHGAPELLRHFHILFNGMIQHSCVPTAFLKGTISPIVKDSHGDVSSPSNYRGVTLSCLPAKLFEHAIQIKTYDHLFTDDLQFGFKRKTSTSHAIFALKSTVDHFISHGSKVYVAFLDCTKAFDRISHSGLFTKLIERKIPLCFLLCLLFWYQNMYSVVKWGDETSREFPVPLGIKQGGINSPDFFSCYFDGLTTSLRSNQFGCHIADLFIGCIFFADDICLLSPSRSGLEQMISRCTKYCSEFCLSFNPRKSKVMIFSRSAIDLANHKPVLLDGSPIDYATSIKYLGVTIDSNKGVNFPAENDLQSFYRSANSVLNVLKKPDETILMHLLFRNCVPTLTYACAVKEYSQREMNACMVALNDAIRKIFTFRRWESVRQLRINFGYLSLSEIFWNTRKKFLESVRTHRNGVISKLARLIQPVVD